MVHPMRSRTLFLMVAGVCVFPLELSASQAGQNQAAAQTGQAVNASPGFRLENGTPVKLRLQRTISSADAHADDKVDFDVLEEVKINDVVVIPKGGIAWGTVTEAQPKRRMARGGKLNVNVDAVRLADGEKAALSAVKDVKGGGHTGAMTGAMVATGIVFFPAAPFFLFMHGKDITIPKGTEITAYINGDFNLDPAKFGPKTSEAQTSAPEPSPAVQASEPSTIMVKSTPDGAEISVDGKFVGNSPASLKVAPGEHSLSIEKRGYKPWQRTMTVTAASTVTIDATLEQQQ